VTVTGTVAATAVTGDGSGLTGVGVTVAEGGDASYSYESGGKNYMVHVFRSTTSGVFRTNKDMTIDLIPQNAITVVIASKGYPGEFQKGVLLPSLKNLNEKNEISVFHSGTAKDKNENLISNGGRVLSITSIGANVQDCRKKAYDVVEAINWEQGFYRKDIGKL